MRATEIFEAERPRLLLLATGILHDHGEAQDVVQQAWLRLDAADADILSVPAWLTTVTTRLCLDRLRARLPEPHDSIEAGTAPDPADEVALADAVGVALQVVLERLAPKERVAFVLHDTFAFDFATIAALLDTTPMAARKLASRARSKIDRPMPEAGLTDWKVVDAFMAAARQGNFESLLRLLAPEVQVRADDAAVLAGTPARIDGRQDVAGFFNGRAAAALAVSFQGRPGAAWFHRGHAEVLFDFAVVDGQVARITFRADPTALAQVVRRGSDD
jgi:RNA polymerase sigma-70 factor (ECF subfamily)